jgi:ribosomal protein S27AE
MFQDRNPRTPNMLGVMSPRKRCSQCGDTNPMAGGKFFRGTSRLNPTRWACAKCKENLKQED